MATQTIKSKKNYTYLLICSFLFFVIGDLATTYIGLNLTNIYETNVVIRNLMNEYSIYVIFPIKIGMFIFLYLLGDLLEYPYNYAIHGTLSIIGLVVTSVNILVILTV